MNKNELDLLVRLSHFKTMVDLFLSAFEEQNYPTDAITAMYIIAEQVDQLMLLSKNISINLVEQSGEKGEDSQ